MCVYVCVCGVTCCMECNIPPRGIKHSWCVLPSSPAKNSSGSSPRNTKCHGSRSPCRPQAHMYKPLAIACLPGIDFTHIHEHAHAHTFSLHPLLLPSCPPALLPSCPPALLALACWATWVQTGFGGPDKKYELASLNFAEFRCRKRTAFLSGCFCPSVLPQNAAVPSWSRPCTPIDDGGNGTRPYSAAGRGVHEKLCVCVCVHVCV